MCHDMIQVITNITLSSSLSHALDLNETTGIPFLRLGDRYLNC